MGKYRINISTPALKAKFRIAYNIPLEVGLLLANEGEIPECTPSSVPFPIIAIVEGRVRFPLPSLYLEFFGVSNLTPSQLTMNSFRIIGSAIGLGEILNINLGLPELFSCYTLAGRKNGRFYLRHKSGQVKFLFHRPDKEKHHKDYIIVSGPFEYPAGQDYGPYTIARSPGLPSRFISYVAAFLLLFLALSFKFELDHSLFLL